MQYVYAHGKQSNSHQPYHEALQDTASILELPVCANNAPHTKATSYATCKLMMLSLMLAQVLDTARSIYESDRERTFDGKCSLAYLGMSAHPSIRLRFPGAMPAFPQRGCDRW